MDVVVALAGSPEAATADFVCDGTGDEVEINAAIAAVGAAGGGTVHLAAGAYVTNAPIEIIDSNVSIAGAGPASTTITAAANWLGGIGPGGAELTGIVTFCGVDNFSCSNVTVDGNTNSVLCNGIIAIPSGPTTGTGQACTNGIIENNHVFLDQAHTYSIWSLRGEHIVVQDNLVDGHSTAVNESPFQEGIELFGARDSHVLNNVIQNIGGNGINVGGLADTTPDSVVDGVTIEGNTVTSSRSGVHLATSYGLINGPQDVRNVVVANNVLSNLSEFGIYYNTAGGNVTNPATLSNIDIHDNVIDMRSTAEGSVPAAIWFLSGEGSGVAFDDIDIHDNSITIEQASSALFSEDAAIANNPAYIFFLGIEHFSFSGNQVVDATPQGLSFAATFYGSSNFSVTSNSFSGAGAYGVTFTLDTDFVFNDNLILNWDQADVGSTAFVTFLIDQFDLSGNAYLTFDGSVTLSKTTLNATQVTVNVDGKIGGTGTVDGPILNNGTIVAELIDGAPEDSAASLLLIGPISGSGMIEIAPARVTNIGTSITYKSASLELGAATSSNVVFDDGWGILTLDDPAEYSGKIVPSSLGNEIILSGISVDSVTDYNYSGDSNGGTLAIRTTDGEIDLHFLGNFTTADFTLFAGARQLSSDPAILHVSVRATATTVLSPIAEDSGARLITQAQLLSDFVGPSPVASGLAIASGNGVLVDNHDGTWSYTSANDDDSAVSFSYQVTSGGLSVDESATIDITPVNDAPVNTVPDALSTTADVDHAITGLSVVDVDATSLTTTLHVDHGTLTIAAAGGATVGGSGTATVTLTGSVAQIDAALAAANNVLYHGAFGFLGTDHLTMTSDDGGSTGADGPLSNTGTTAINVLGSLSTTTVLSPIAEDSGARLITQAQLLSDFVGPSPVASGLAIASGNGVLVDNHDGTWSYTSANDDDSAVSFSYQVTSGGLSVDESATIDITPVNDAPVNTVPDALSTTADVDHAITGLSVVDVDATSLTTTLHVDHGTLTIAAAGGATVGGSGTATVTLTGSVAQIDAALAAANNVLYHGAFGFLGTDHLTMTSDDGGSTGADGPLSNTGTTAINVLGKNVSFFDFGSDHKSDILWQIDNGNVAIWDNGQPAGEHRAGSVPSNWHIAGIGDFDGNGHGDILWQTDNGSVAIWDNGQPAGEHSVGSAPSNWHIAGTGDFDGNGHGDVLWYNNNGSVAIWDNGQATGGHVVANAGAASSSWHIAGTGDFDGNGRSDVLWYNDNGSVAIWDNGQATGGHVVANAGAVSSSWHIAGTGDFDGNGRSDVLWYDDNSSVAIWDNGQPGGGHVVANAGTVPTDWHIV